MGSTTYDRMLVEIEPEAIETEARYGQLAARLADLVGKGARRTAAETRLMKLLAVLVEDYDRRHGLPPDDSTPAERLRYLLEVSGKPSSALLAVFGQRSHVIEALNGKRPISSDQARRLGVLFGVAAGYFV
jgi:antitoxin component HigA of HigAB toxin-antitoxin module